MADDGNAVLLQRLEGAAAIAVGIAAYAWLDQPWWVFALLLIVPDLSMLGYLRSAVVGMYTYNLAHTYVVPVLLMWLGLAVGPTAFGLAATWTAHIGIDRMLGFGLKYRSGFGRTHLGPVGAAARQR